MTTTAAEQVAGNIYLLEEILIRVPAKSLTRSKLVSKQWLAHISNAQFVQHHIQQKPNRLRTGMFITDSKCNCRDADFVAFNNLNPTHHSIPSLGFLYDGIRQQIIVGDDDDGKVVVPEIKILNSCNGLFLCIVNFSTSSSNYIVCSPTTKAFRLIPTTTGPVSPGSAHYLAFDPSDSLHYKLVIYSPRNDPVGCGNLLVYSSDVGSWKKIESPFHPDNYEGGFFLNDSIYWLSQEKSFCFNVYNEEMKPFNAPPKTNPWVSTLLAVVGSRLYCLDREHGDKTADYRVLEMSSDFSEWVTKYDDSVWSLFPGFPHIFDFGNEQGDGGVVFTFSGICVVEGVKEDEEQLVLGIPNYVVLYNLKKKTKKKLYDLHGELSRHFGYKRARIFQFIETISVV